MNYSNICRLQLIKLSSRAIFLLLGAFAIISVLLAVGVFSIPITISDNEVATGEAHALAAFYIYTGQLSGFVMIFISLLTIIHTSRDHRYGVLRKHIMDGHTREEYYLGLLFKVLFVSTLLLVLYVGLYIACGILFFQQQLQSLLGPGSLYVRLWIALVIYASMGLLSSIVFKSSGFAMLAFIAYLFVEKLTIVFDEARLKLGLLRVLPVSLTNESVTTAPLGFMHMILLALYLLIFLSIPFLVLRKQNITQ